MWTICQNIEAITESLKGNGICTAGATGAEKGEPMSLIEEITCLDVLRREISCQQEKLACLEDAARYMSLSFVDRGGRPSGPGDKVGRMSAKILDEREKLEKMAEQYALTVERAVEIIGTLHNTLERKVLMRRYVLGKA